LCRRADFPAQFANRVYWLMAAQSAATWGWPLDDPAQPFHIQIQQAKTICPAWQPVARPGNPESSLDGSLSEDGMSHDNNTKPWSRR
jgi:hypothetical protein